MTRQKQLWGFCLMLSFFAAACSSSGGKRWSGGYERGLNKSAEKYLQSRLGGTIPHYDIPIVVNDRVLNEIDYLLSTGERLYRYLARSSRYEAWMKSILKEEGVPQDLFYLALIESGFSNHAYSRARALGPWQFIRSTGRIFGLESNWWLDERKDPEKATRAAARYLKRLYGEFGDWYLALAAYNAGEGKIRKAVRHSGEKDFWSISKEGSHHLKLETKHYVPRFIAAALIAKMPARFAVGPIDYDVPFQFEVVPIGGSLELTTAAKLIDVEPGHLAYLNPELNHLITPPGSYSLRIPPGTRGKFLIAYAELPEEVKSTKMAHHQIRRGDNLWRIAKRYGVSPNSLMLANNLHGKKDKHLRVGSTLVIPVKRMSVQKPILLAYQPPKKKEKMDGVEYLIRQDNTENGAESQSIEKASDVEEEDVIQSAVRKSVGNKKGILMAQTPSLQESDLSGTFTSEPPQSTDQVVIQPKEETIAKVIERDLYVVKKGDNLWQIAKKNGIRFSDLKRWNRLSDGNVRAGQVLHLTAASASQFEPVALNQERNKKKGAPLKARHTVRNGENLWQISRKYRVSVAQLKGWNQIEGATLHVGKVLLVAPPSTPNAKEIASGPATINGNAIVQPSPSQATAAPPPKEEF